MGGGVYRAVIWEYGARNEHGNCCFICRLLR